MPLRALYDRLGHALRGLDLAVETRPYQPHVTFARRAGAAIPPAAPAPVVWWARSFVLVVSTGDRAQPYRVFRQYADGTE
jgi:2'-5' RNA ligase